MRVIDVINIAFTVYKWLLIIRILFSWINHNPSQPVIKFIYDVTEPVLKPFRRIIPTAGGIDFSPIIVFFLLYLLQTVLYRIFI